MFSVAASTVKPCRCGKKDELLEVLFSEPVRTVMTAVNPELLALCDSIDNIDAALIHLLAERFKCTQAVGRLKAERGLPPADPGREAQQIARLRKLADA